MWNNILNEVKKFKFKNSYNDTWFRGQKKQSGCQLNSTLFRESVTTLEKIESLERQYYNYFKNMGHVYHNETDWNLVFLMQHYGVHTRLLDWTESFATALYFATLNWNDDENINIWMLSPQALNRKSRNDARFFTIDNDSYRERLYKENRKTFELNSIAVYPVKNNMRIVAQQGVFTIQGNGLKPLEQELWANEEILRCIEITPDLREDALAFLEFSGVNAFTLFPDLDGLARYINKKHSPLPNS